MAIPKHIVEDVKHATRMSELLGKFLSLKRAGKEFHALCPFHQEKTPSFTVNDEKGFYHCFGCGAHGDGIGFLMQHEHMAYVEAVRHLADLAGIFIPEESPENIAQQAHVDSLYEVMERAASWFSQRLQSEDGWQAREYIQRRGLSQDITDRFMLGYAPPDRTALKSHLQKLGISERQMLAVGLLTKPDSGDAYDKFRSRLMFPIFNAAGHVIAFGGRLISDDPESRAPKYLNSPETELFKKRSQVYASPSIVNERGQRTGGALAAARNTGRLLVVEGYMDVIACVQAGIEAVVATLGTAFTEEHVQRLWRAVDEPILCLDGDSAGSRAMIRAAELALPLLVPGKSLRFMRMPEGEDPDTLLKRSGKAALDKLADQALPLHEVIVNAHASKVDMRDPVKRAKLEQDLEKLASEISDPTTRQHIRQYFKEAMWQKGRPAKRGGKAVAPQIRSMSLPDDPMEKLNLITLKLFLLHPQLLEYAIAEELLMKVSSHNEALEEIKAALQFFHSEHEAAGLSLAEHMQAEGLEDLLQQILQNKNLVVPRIDLQDPNSSQQMLAQWLIQLDTCNLENEYQRLAKTIHNQNSDDAMLERMMALQQEIRQRKAMY